jgi:hypothetical protein
LLEFYRTAAELRLSVNRYSHVASADFSKQLAEAAAKLETLKALKEYDIDSEMITLIAEIEVNILRGDAEQVNLFLLGLILGFTYDPRKVYQIE